MWTVYFAFGFHSIRHCTSEEFQKLKRFYKLRKHPNEQYANDRGDVFAWKDSEV